MALRVGIVDYLNSWPLAWSFLSGNGPDGFEPSCHPPARVATMLACGSLDVGLIPSIEVQRIPDLAVVPGLCVAATHEVRSVLLISERRFEDVRSVALDENSRTSAALVRILLADGLGVEPEMVTREPRLEEMLEGADAALIIGDPALDVDRRRYRILDLAQEWRRLTGRPFVFAVWAVRPGVDASGLTEVLNDSLALGMREMEQIVARAVADLELDAAVAQRYLRRHLSYRLGMDELAGLEEFYRRALEHRAIAEISPLRFVE